jgi:subfamily B ATP-binding cassette protein HlyB/CyaB
MDQRVSRASSPFNALIRVAGTHGVELTLDALKRAYSKTDAEMPSATLVVIARDAGLQLRISRPKWKELARFTQAFPAIVRLKDGGAGVIVGVRSSPATGQVVVMENPDDPSEPLIAVDQPQFHEIWSGELMLVRRRRESASEIQPFGLGWLVGQVLRERQLFRAIALASIVTTLCALTPPLIVMNLFDRVLVNRSVSTLEVLAGGLGLVIMVETGLSFLRRSFMEVTATRIDAHLNLYLMQRILALPLEYFEQTATGRIMSKLGKVWQIRNFITGQLFSTIIDVTMLIVIVPVLVIIEWHLAILVFVLVSIIFCIIYFFLKPLTRSFARVTVAEQGKNTFLTETVYGMRTIKSLALEGRRLEDWDSHVAKAASSRHGFGAMANYPQTFTLPFERLIYGGSIMAGAALALAVPNVALPGALMAFGMLAGRTAQPLVQMARLLQELGEIRGAVYEAASILNHPMEESRIGTGLHLPVYGNITFQNVGFRYVAGAPLALNDVSVDIRAGSVIGIMGRSGSGKTTITRLLQGLSPNYEGIIKIDGMDLREMDLRHLRTNIGVVAQENFLFSGTIRDNIGIARPNATFAEIIRAAQLAGAEEFIERLPRGYDTRLEEGATNLSGGQRQRLAIARALVLDPPILILDEATSALDAESEAIINANLQRIAQSRTIICVSHRLSMLVAADSILVMEKGRVYDAGSHRDLLHRCDIYKHLWNTQNRHVQIGSSHGHFNLAVSSQ